MKVRNFKELIVWQKSMDLVEQVYQTTKQFPKEEAYGLASQLRRAAVSIPSNIAEGQARQSTKEFQHFLSIAQGSRAEVETQILVAMRLNYLDEGTATQILGLLTEIAKMLHTLKARL
ncbi:MAG: four helix bundle protein [Lewinellaceae bacterium]|nr:four helix bundle protein [Lewinellaceae bacterium]